MSLKLFLLLLLGLLLLTTSTFADYDGHYRPPRSGGPYKKGPPEHSPHSSEDTLSDQNLQPDGRGGYQRPPYKKKPPVVETEGKGESGHYDEPEPKPRPRHEPIYGDPRRGDGPQKPPHKPPLEN